MSDREISCCKCGRHVGIIRDAKLMKGLKFICPSCCVVDEKGDYFKPTDKSDFNDMFGGLFKDVFK